MEPEGCMTTIRAGIAAGIVILAGALASARQTAPQTDVLPALLEEVKGLRAAMEQMASAGPRIQLFTSRLQLQETRINNMIRRLDAVRESLASAQREIDAAAEDQRRLEAALAEPHITPEAQMQVQMLNFELTQVKRGAAAARPTVARYTAEEAQLSADLATEQARWTEINARLDELERALAKR